MIPLRPHRLFQSVCVREAAFVLKPSPAHFHMGHFQHGPLSHGPETTNVERRITSRYIRQYFRVSRFHRGFHEPKYYGIASGFRGPEAGSIRPRASA